MRGFIRNPGSGMQSIGTLLAGTSSEAFRINDSGQVAGYSAALGVARAVRYSAAGGMTDLGTFTGGAWSVAYGINDLGTVIGQSDTLLAPDLAFRHIGSGSMQTVGILPAGVVHSLAMDVNDTGQITGYYYTNTDYRPFLFTAADGLLTLPMATGVTWAKALAISGTGQVVGTGGTAAGNRAFLYRPGEGTVDLNSLLPGNSGWTLYTAEAISDNNLVAGYGLYQGQIRAYMLDLTSYDLQVPEPGFRWMGLAGVALILAARLRGRQSLS